MGRVWMVALVGVMASGCAANVQMVQRDGCWVRRTESFPKSVKEEIGVCGRPPPVWSNDRVARLVQECMADADFRWQNEALAAWNANRPLPPQISEHEMMKQCMTDASTSVITENEALKKRIGEIASERDTLRSEAAQDRDALRQNQEHMTDALGEAAKRPAPNAYATSNSNGTASTQSDQQSSAALRPADSNATVTVPVIENVPSSIPQPPPVKKHAPRAQPKELTPQCTLPGSSLQDGSCAPTPGPQPR